MKAKYIFASLVAALGLLVSCEKEGPHFLNEVKVTSSYVSVPLGGGSNSIKVDATGAWSLAINGKADWLTISPTSGSAGVTEVSFSAPSAPDGRSAEVLLTCNGATQHINVIQGVATVSNATCAEVNAGPDSKTYRVTGVVTSIVNTQYGNWYLQDSTGQIYIYGTLDAKGQTKNFLSWGLEVGDEITVEGPKTTYGSTVELVDVTVIKINKSLMKVAEMDPADAEMPVEGGNFTVTLDNKGEGVYVEIPADAKDWLSISKIAGNVVTFNVAPNAGGDRSTTITFKTTDGKKDYSAQQALAQKGSIIECSVADFRAAKEDDTQYRMTGVITELYASDKQGKSFTIADYSGSVLIYRVEGFLESGAKVGDVVTVVGKRSSYKDSPQMAAGGTFEALKYVVTPVSIAEFLTKEDSKTVYYMITATIKDLHDNKGQDNDWGNLYLTDGTNDLYVYGCYPGWGATGDARKGLVAKLGLKVGDQLSVIGTKGTYGGAPQVANGIYFSHTPATVGE